MTKKVVAGITFDSIPFRGGQISCNGLNAPINRYFYVSSGTKCIAKPNSGYEFASWVEVFDDNSTRTINASKPADSLLAVLRDVFSDNPAANLSRTVSAPVSSDSPLALEALHNAFTDDPAATLTVNRFGNLAYFKSLPPPVPAEFTASLITVIVASFVGSLLIPAAVGWSKTKKQISRLNSFHLDMVSINKDGLDETDIKNLNELNQRISNSYAAGRITNEQYTNLKNEVSIAFQEIFKKRIESLKEQDLEAINKTRNDIMDAAYNNGKLSSEHYTNLTKEISNTYQKIFKKRIESLTEQNPEVLTR